MKISLRHGILKSVPIWVLLAAALAVAAAAAGGWWYLRQNSEGRAYGLAAQARMHQEQGRPAMAARTVREAIRIRDDVAEFHLLLGRVLVQEGDLVGAFQAYNNASSLAPGNVEALAAVAQIGVQIGRIDQAREATRSLLLISPRQPEGLLVKGILAMTGRDYDEAIDFADQILSGNPGHQEAIILKIRASVLAGEEEQARELLAEFAPVFGDNASFAITELEVARQLEDPERMLKAFETLREALPQRTDLRLDEASLHFKLGNHARSAQILVEVLSDPDLPPGDIGGAVQQVNLIARTGELLPLLPRLKQSGSTDAKMEVAKLLVRRDQASAARSLVEDITGTEKSVLEALIDVKEGRTAKALAAAERILEADDTHCFARHIKAQALLDQLNYRDAVYSAQLATTECPTLIESWGVLAQAYAGLGMPSQSDRAYSQGLEANPQEPWLVAQFVDWLVRNDRQREALAAKRKLVRAMPGYTPAWDSYLAHCRALSSSCERDALRGREESLTIYGVDPPPGERATSGLFGRILIR